MRKSAAIFGLIIAYFVMFMLLIAGIAQSSSAESGENEQTVEATDVIRQAPMTERELHRTMCDVVKSNPKTLENNDEALEEENEKSNVAYKAASETYAEETTEVDVLEGAQEDTEDSMNADAFYEQSVKELEIGMNASGRTYTASFVSAVSSKVATASKEHDLPKPPVTSFKNVEVEPMPENYKKKINLVSTAYCPCKKCCGKDPDHPAYGLTYHGIDLMDGEVHKVVAVDPKVIPLGSKVYVPDYGIAIAADIGGGIKGDRIDVYYPNHEEAWDWKHGMQNIDVYILEYPEGYVPYTDK